MEIKRFLIYPWDLSSTSNWTMEGLHGLRDESPQEIAEILRSDQGDIEEIYVAAMAEYLSHGYQRKAAEVSRALVAIEPTMEILIKNRFKSVLAVQLLKTDLDLLPSRPMELPAGSIEYVH